MPWLQEGGQDRLVGSASMDCVHCVKVTVRLAVIHGLVLLMMGIMMPETC